MKAAILAGSVKPFVNSHKRLSVLKSPSWLASSSPFAAILGFESRHRVDSTYCIPLAHGRDPLIEYIVSESNIERIANVTGFSKEGEGTRKGCAEQQLNQPDTTDVEGHFIKIFHLSCSCIRISAACATGHPTIAGREVRRKWNVLMHFQAIFYS